MEGPPEAPAMQGQPEGRWRGGMGQKVLGELQEEVSSQWGRAIDWLGRTTKSVSGRSKSKGTRR